MEVRTLPAEQNVITTTTTKKKVMREYTGIIVVILLMSFIGGSLYFYSEYEKKKQEKVVDYTSSAYWNWNEEAFLHNISVSQKLDSLRHRAPKQDPRLEFMEKCIQSIPIYQRDESTNKACAILYTHDK